MHNYIGLADWPTQSMHIYVGLKSVQIMLAATPSRSGGPHLAANTSPRSDDADRRKEELIAEVLELGRIPRETKKNPARSGESHVAVITSPRSDDAQSIVSQNVQKLIEEVLRWQKHNKSRGVQKIPNQHAIPKKSKEFYDDSEERNLGNRFAKVLLRRNKSLGTAPSQLQLSPSEVALVNSVPGVPLRGCSATASCNSNVDQHQPELPIMPNVNHSVGIHHAADTTDINFEHYQDVLERQQEHIETLKSMLTDMKTKPSDSRIMELAERFKVTELGDRQHLPLDLIFKRVQQQFHDEVWDPQMLTTPAGQPAASKPNEPSLSEPRSSRGVSHLVRTLVEDVVAWQRRNEVQRIPNKNAGSFYDDSEERNLGIRFAKVLLRRDKALGSAPSQLQLSPSEMALVNSVSGVPLFGCSATASCNSNVAQQRPELTTMLNVHDDIGTHLANKKARIESAGTGSGGPHPTTPSNRIEEGEGPSSDLAQCASTKKRPRHTGRILHTGSSDIEQLTDTRQELRSTMIFMKILEPIWAIEVAEGQKMFECVANKGRWQNQFKQLASGDIIVICIKGQNKVSAVCEVASAATVKETNRDVLKSKLQESRHEALDAYLDDAESFDYVEFKHVFDCRCVLSESSTAAFRCTESAIGIASTLAESLHPRFFAQDADCQIQA